MPVVVRLGLPAVNRSLFGFRKADRSSTAPSPVPSSGPVTELSVRDDHFGPAPELPPLHSLNFNSFANLLNHVELAPLSSETSTKSRAAPSTASELSEDVTPSLSETPTQHDAKSTENMASLEFMTTGTYFSNMASRSSSGTPERQQSRTSSTSLSKHSDTDSSVGTASSRSSVDDTPSKPTSYDPHNPVNLDHIDTDFLTAGFKDTQLNLELTHGSLSRSSTPSDNDAPSPILDTNKPLPPAPSAASRNSKVANGVVLPELASSPGRADRKSQDHPSRYRAELDANSVRKEPRSQSRTETDYQKPDAMHLKSMPVAKASALSQSRSTEDVRAPVPQSKVSSRLDSRSQTSSRRDSKEKSLLNLADQVIFQILLRVQSITDLKSAALTNKRFYRVFKRNEPEIVEEVLRNASPAAWELRQLVQREQKRNPYGIRAVQRDLTALRALQAFVLMRCGKLCRPSTVEGLMGDDLARRADIENALWRIWTFCKLFGKGTSRDSSVHAQIMWLEGTTAADKSDKYILQPDKRAAPPSKVELEDMSEMWRCLEILLSNFRGREPEAREAGIFDQCQIDEEAGKTETHYLEDWIYDVLSVGPKAVLTMISCSFEHAKVLGVNKWTPPRQGRSRRPFLKAALEQVYRDRLVEGARLEAQDFARSVQQRQKQKQKQQQQQRQQQKQQRRQEEQQQQSLGSRSRSDPVLSDKVQVTSLPLHRSTSEKPLANKTKADEKPQVSRLAIRPDCDPESSLHDPHQMPANSPTTNPAAFSSIAMMSNASARLGATLFPLQQINALMKMESNGETSKASDVDTDTDSVDLVLEPKVVDPSDRALSLLVKQLGFPEHLAKQALAMSDDGAGIDVQRAVELLSNDRRLVSSRKETSVAELPGALPKSSPDLQQQVKDYCEGTCQRPSLINRRKSTFRGLMSRTSLRQSFRLSVIVDQEDEDSTAHQAGKETTAPSDTEPASAPATTTPARTQETKPAYHNLTEFIKYRNSIRSQPSVKRNDSLLRGHKKSSSTGTIEFSEEDTNKSLSPVSPMAPVHCLGGFQAIKAQPHIINDKEIERGAQITTRPKVTLTRVGTGKKPSRRLSFSRTGSIRPGQPPEIIGYTY